MSVYMFNKLVNDVCPTFVLLCGAVILLGFMYMEMGVVHALPHGGASEQRCKWRWCNTLHTGCPGTHLLAPDGGAAELLCAVISYGCLV